MITYTLKPITEGEEQVIIKAGAEHEFKMSEVSEHLEKLRKLKVQLTSQKEVEDAKCENVKHFNSFIKDLTDEQLNAAYLYAGSYKLSKACAEKLVEIEEAQKEYAEELSEIEKQTGLKL